MTGPEVTQPDPDGGVEMTDGEWAAFRGVEVTAAMKAEDAWVEKAARGWWDWGATMRKATGHGREWDELDEDERALVRSRVRTALAPVVPEIQAQALRDFADGLPSAWQRPNGLADAARSHAEHLLECTCADVDSPTATTEEPT